jgi:mRNA interferase RelE/StbE
MIFKIELTPAASRDIRKLTGVELKRVDACLMGLSENPFSGNVKKLVGSDSMFRVRVGDYRIIYSVDNDILTVLIIKIGHRREIYR